MRNQLFSRQNINQYLSNIAAVAGVKEIEYASGPAKGVRALEVYTGSGFRFVVLPDRGMDIAEATYKGIPIAWVGKQGIFAPQFFQNGDLEFMKVFFAGLLTTCGLTQAGKPCVDESIIFGKEAYGLHGRINTIPAENCGYQCEWAGEEYRIKLFGQVRQARLYGENLLLKREIETSLGSNEILITDEVINEGHMPTEMMLLYHLNFGYPVVSENSRLSTNYQEGLPFNDFAKTKDGNYTTYGRPEPEYLNDNYWLKNPTEEDVNLTLFNEKIGLGVKVEYSNKSLPYCTEWINLAAQDYVVGLEPGNCMPEGRVNARENKRLDTIAPRETKKFKLRISLIDRVG